jgi:hypothetical protein
MVFAHVAGGGLVSDLIYIALPLLIVGLMIVGPSRKAGIALIAAALVLGAVGGIDVWRKRPKSSAGVTMTVVSPKSGDTVAAGQPISLDVQVSGLTLAPITAAVNRPGEGHLHTYVDDALYAMWSNQADDKVVLPPGPHQLRVEVTSNDHRPLSPAVEQTIALTAR